MRLSPFVRFSPSRCGKNAFSRPAAYNEVWKFSLTTGGRRRNMPAVGRSGRSPAYYDFSRIGGDCTNFASQGLYAGAGS